MLHYIERIDEYICLLDCVTFFSDWGKNISFLYMNLDCFHLLTSILQN